MELVIFVGLQASGKTSFYQRYFSKTHIHISKDLWPNFRRPQIRQMRLLEQSLQHGCSVVIDNTNPSPMDRAPLLALGKRYATRCIGYYFQTNLQEAMERNVQREGRKRVPEVAFFSTIKLLCVPSYEEGFDKLYTVRLSTDQQFFVEAS